MKSCAVVIGLLVGCIVAAACGYFDRSGIDGAPVGSFIWVHTFKLSIYGPIVLPLLAVYIVLVSQSEAFSDRWSSDEARSVATTPFCRQSEV